MHGQVRYGLARYTFAAALQHGRNGFVFRALERHVHGKGYQLTKRSLDLRLGQPRKVLHIRIGYLRVVAVLNVRTSVWICTPGLGK